VTDKTNGHGLHPRVKELASGENFAALTTISLPVIVLYVAMRRQFIQGLTAGALKG